MNSATDCLFISRHLSRSVAIINHAVGAARLLEQSMSFKYKSLMPAGLTVWILASTLSVACADRHEPRPAAKADFDRATSMLKENETRAAVVALKKAIEADPEFIEAHDKYIETVENSIIVHDSSFDKTTAIALATLKAQYVSWAARYPKSAGIAYGLGRIYLDAEDPRGKPYLLKAVSLNPKLAEAYEQLSYDADLWGNGRASLDYMGKASELEPQNADYAFSLAFRFQESDHAKYVELSLDVARRFPRSQRAAQALFWLGENSHSDAEKVRYWEQARTQFPPDKFMWTASSMDMLFEIYARTDPDKALTLAREMQSKVSKDDAAEWTDDALLAQNVVAVRQLFAAGKYAEAKAILDKTKVRRRSADAMMIALLRAEAAAGAGDTSAAYEDLLRRYAKTPEDAVHEALLNYAGKEGKASEQVEHDIWALRDASAKPAPPFDLPNYLSGKKTSLHDYRGKVVLLTFWFPGCGPCRSELPHLQSVMKKFTGKDVAYIGINTMPLQDGYVVPFVKTTHYTFTPLRGNRDLGENAYHTYDPGNFLIDQTGNVIYSDFWAYDPGSERVLQLMIQSMLDHKPTR
jgi:thiol-disulfide isomerase/thioredoxin/Tfp pilus assembly protein PilF